MGDTIKLVFKIKVIKNSTICTNIAVENQREVEQIVVSKMTLYLKT